jgi:hypothetical protein
VIVAPVMGENHVIRLEGMAYANSNTLLSGPKMGGCAHLLLLVAFSESLLSQSHLKQILVQGDEKVRPGHFCPQFLIV